MNKKSKNLKPAWSILGIVMLINTYIFLMQKKDFLLRIMYFP